MRLLLLLLVSSQAVPPVLSQTYETFVKQHSYDGTRFVVCSRDMSPVLKALDVRCKPCNTFILGDHRFKTNMADVKQVCTGGGTKKFLTNRYVSKKDFRIVTCRKKKPVTTRGMGFSCSFSKVAEEDIESRRITVTCEDDLPTELHTC